jgi:hypothetical protein
MTVKRLGTQAMMDALDCGRDKLGQLVKSGELPAPVRDPGSCKNYWLEEDLKNFLTRLAQRREQVREEPARLRRSRQAHAA